MFVTNGKKITVSDAADEEQLENFAAELFDSFNKYKGFKGRQAIKPELLTAEKSGIDKPCIVVPDKLELNFMLDFGCQLGALSQNDIIAKRGRTTLDLKHVFTPEESATKSMNLANAVQEIMAIDNDKKTSMSAYDNRLKAARAQQNLLANQVANGYEIRNQEVEVQLNFMDQTRIYIDPVTKKHVGEEAFQPEDYQFKMFDA